MSILPQISVFPQNQETFSKLFYCQRRTFYKEYLIKITIILHENCEHVPAVSIKFGHLSVTSGAVHPPRNGLAYLGKYQGQVLSKVYAFSNHLQPDRLLKG